MSEDNSTQAGLWVVGLVVSAVVIGALTFGAYGVGRTGHPTQGAPQAVDRAIHTRPLTSVYFAVGEARLSGSAAQAVEQAVHAAMQEPGKVIELSGYHDASGDRASNAELARQRAVAVRDALVAAGIATERIRLQKPQALLGAGSPSQARRVDITLVAAI